MPESTEQPSRSPRILLDPEWDGNACLYLTAHAARRLQQRFGLSSLRHTPFVEFTYYCEPTDIVRPVWAIPISGAHGPGYILGRWEQSIQESRYRHWFVGTTCINEQQFKNSRLVIVKTTRIRVVRVMNQLQYWKMRGLVEK